MLKLRVTVPPPSSSSSASQPPAGPTPPPAAVPAQPTPAPPNPAPLPPPPAGPVQFGLDWLMTHGSPPVQYRAIVDVARLSPPHAGDLPYAWAPAIRIAMTQQSDGRWGKTMLGIPSMRADHFEGVGTISAVRRLLEYGWDRESPPLVRVRRLLFRLLAEDDDPAYLFEFATKGKPDEDGARRGRAILREAA